MTTTDCRYLSIGLCRENNYHLKSAACPPRRQCCLFNYLHHADVVWPQFSRRRPGCIFCGRRLPQYLSTRGSNILWAIEVPYHGQRPSKMSASIGRTVFWVTFPAKHREDGGHYVDVRTPRNRAQAKATEVRYGRVIENDCAIC